MIYAQFRLGYRDFDDITEWNEGIMKSLFIDVIVKTTDEDRSLLSRLVRHLDLFLNNLTMIEARE